MWAAFVSYDSIHDELGSICLHFKFDFSASQHSILAVELFDVDFFGRLHASASVLFEFPESLYLSQSNMGL